jgi:hypothetical protein
MHSKIKPGVAGVAEYPHDFELDPHLQSEAILNYDNAHFCDRELD